MTNRDVQKPVRSFVRREGRLTAGQQRALENLWPLYGIDSGGGVKDFNALFRREASRVLEIGFGNGESLAQMAAENPQCDFIGIEVHRPGIGHLLQIINRQQLNNIRLFCGDAIAVLEQNIEDASLAQLNLFFPDPWPKQRHHKRRIVRADFVDLLERKLTATGIFHVATDWENYKEHIENVMAKAAGRFRPVTPDCALPRPPTKFESRGVRLGHGVWDRVYQRQK